MQDVVIIGGGAVGCAVARELSRWQLDVCLVEQGEDVCVGTSKANSAIVHAGFDGGESEGAVQRGGQPPDGGAVPGAGLPLSPERGPGAML